MRSDNKQQRFELFHKDNPHVAERLKLMAKELLMKGFSRWGICNLWEKLRYDLAIETSSTDFRLNDHYKPYYSRLLMRDEPVLANFFETRKQISLGSI